MHSYDWAASHSPHTSQKEGVFHSGCITILANYDWAASLSLHWRWFFFYSSELGFGKAFIYFLVNVLLRCLVSPACLFCNLSWTHGLSLVESASSVLLTFLETVVLWSRYTHICTCTVGTYAHTHETCVAHVCILKSLLCAKLPPRHFSVCPLALQVGTEQHPLISLNAVPEVTQNQEEICFINCLFNSAFFISLNLLPSMC